MSTGLQQRKVRIRQLYVEGKVDRNALLDAEAILSQHCTCTFTALQTLTKW